MVPVPETQSESSMTHAELRQTLLAFLSLPERVGAMPMQERIRELCLALDRVGSVIHFAEAPDDDNDYPELESVPYKERYARWQAAFPDFNHYNMALQVLGLPTEAEFGTGDPYDDLADLSADLQGAVDRWDSRSFEDAMGHLRLLHFHWGAHLRWLQLYLHERACKVEADEGR